ncbi:efflux RND transporter periplasmic adaptor subunit [Corallincola luteus]|uniref:Efflux RND transporter periplasmic adaptor subunit n=3 Tax=Psychromonadaceae TaxID=267894 RepID=A0A368NMH4_9GAMM|nr:efflux RND transporter periplasmic adaptor subunit [Corallincola holothuriorum]TCI01836.1 efflux RND transporter periplasmic adaptor subunit [Corallincola luteus]
MVCVFRNGFANAGCKGMRIKVMKYMTFQPRVLAHTVCALLATGLMACTPAEQAVKAPQNVEVVRVSSDIARTKRDFPAVIQANNLSHLSFRVEGELKTLPVTSGMNVKKGDLLATLDAADYERQVTDTKETYKLAKLNFERAQKLIKTGAISASESDKLEAEYLIAKANHELAKIHLGFTQLRAPKDGIIGRVIADNFENVRVGEAILTLHDAETLEVQVNVSEQLLALAKPDRESRKAAFQVRFESLPGKVYTATSYEFETEKDPQTKSYLAKLLMDNPVDVPIFPGMSAVVTVDMSDIERDSFQGINLPSSAVVFRPDSDIDGRNTFVWKLSDDEKSVSMHAVETRKLGRTGIELKSGVKPGDVIVTYGQQQLFEGAPVKVVAEKEIKG